LFDSAEWYDRSINWDARLKRELPFLKEVFGPPGPGGILDAGCGTGRHVAALAQAGYRTVGLDLSPDMLAVARDVIADAGPAASLVEGGYADAARAGRNFDGVICLANALAAAGSAEAIQEGLRTMAEVLRPGGRLVVQILNFAKLRSEHPAVRGPRIARHENQEYISTRVFQFDGHHAEVVNVTLWQTQGAWKQWSRSGRLYALDPAELKTCLNAAGFALESTFGTYAHEPFNMSESDDLIVVARRT
jgi:SAM-dependent methyltransferase